MYETCNLISKPQITLRLKPLEREICYSISLMLTVKDLSETQSYTEFNCTFCSWNNKYFKDSVKKDSS